MKYCTKCGKELMDEAVRCVGCGCLTSTAPVHRPAPAPVPAMIVQKRTNWIGWPIIGLALQVLLFILAFVRGTWLSKSISLHPLNGTMVSSSSFTFAQRAWMYPRALAVSCACIVLIAGAIFSIVFYARQCFSKYAQRGHIIIISAAAAELLAYIICLSCFPKGVFPCEDSIENRFIHQDGVLCKVISREYELGELCYIQLFLYLALIIISILGCVIKHKSQQRSPVAPQ